MVLLYLYPVYVTKQNMYYLISFCFLIFGDFTVFSWDEDLFISLKLKGLIWVFSERKKTYFWGKLIFSSLVIESNQSFFIWKKYKTKNLPIDFAILKK